MLSLAATSRDTVSRKENTKIRDEGSIPAIVYGAKEKPTPITMGRKEFEKVWKDAGESTVVTLRGVGENKEVLIQDVDVDPIQGVARHADLYVLEKGKAVEVRTPLVFVGVAPAEKDLGGTLIKVLHDIAIEALPKDLPHEIEVDIAGLKDFESQILASDIKMPPGCTLTENPEEVVALVSEPKDETVEEEEAPAFDPNAVQVEKKGKEETAEGAEE